MTASAGVQVVRTKYGRRAIHPAEPRRAKPIKIAELLGCIVDSVF
jgi:hypothetical protein